MFDLKRGPRGQQQLILILLAIRVIGVAIAAGLELFSSNQAEQSKLAIINDLHNLGQMVFKFRRRLATMAGGAGSYLGFTLPGKIATNQNAIHTLTVGENAITVVATSYVQPINKITVTVDSNRTLTSWTYEGDFQ